MKKLILGMTLIVLAGAGHAAFGANGGKVTICHKGQTVSINASGLNGHMQHGDTEGSCANRESAVVILHCAAAEEPEEGIVVTEVSVSDSVTDAYPEPGEVESPIPEVGDNCANALAALLDVRMQVSSVTTVSDGTTSYLVTGYVSVPPAM